MTSRSTPMLPFRAHALLALNIVLNERHLSRRYIRDAWESSVIAARDDRAFVAEVLAESLVDIVRSLPPGDIFTAVRTGASMTPLLGTDLYPPQSHHYDIDMKLAALGGGFDDESALLIDAARVKPLADVINLAAEHLRSPEAGLGIITDSLRWLLWRRSAYLGEDGWGCQVIPFYVTRSLENRRSESHVKEEFETEGRITGTEWV